MSVAPGPGLTWLPRILKDPLGAMVAASKEFGPVVRVPFGSRVSHLVTTPEHFRHVLAENAANYSKGRTFEKTRGYLGNGLSTSSGDFWRRQRRLMQPTFHKEAVKELSQLMTETIDEVTQRWEKRSVSGEVFDVWPEMMALALRVTTRALFGTEISDLDVIVKSFQIALDHTTRRVLNPIDVPDWLPTLHNIRYKRALKSLDALVYGLIAEQRKAPKPHTLLGMLLAARDPETDEAMSDGQLRDEITTLMLGGHETTGNALAWSWYLLSRNPGACAKMLAEVSALGGDATLEHHDKLPWTTGVFLESMRIYPQNWVMSRDTVAEDTIGGFEIPAATTVFLGVFVSHRDGAFWPEPETFDPGRFVGEADKGRHPFAYIPFGGGQRKCIGSTFATLEAALVLARLSRQFDVRVPDGVVVRPKPSFALRPRGGVPVRLSKR